MWFFFDHYHYPQSSEDNKEDDLNDSVWATVSGFCKTYNVSFEYVLYELSYQNLVMYSKVIPSYIPPDERKKAKHDKVLSKSEYNDLIRNLKRH